MEEIANYSRYFCAIVLTRPDLWTRRSLSEVPFIGHRKMSSGPSMPPFKTPPPMENGATTWRLAATPPHVYGSVPQALRSESHLLESTPPGWVAKVKATLLVMVAILAVWLVCTAIHDDWADLFLAWAGDHRSSASVSIVVLFIPVALMFVPVDVPLYLCAGFMYGFVHGSLLCWIGYNVGSWVGFYFGRWCFRDWLHETTKDQLYIQAIRATIDDNSLVLVLLLQIAPIMPYSMVCYFFGASNCPFFPSYVLGTAIGVIPCVLFFVFIVRVHAASSCCFAAAFR